MRDFFAIVSCRKCVLRLTASMIFRYKRRLASPRFRARARRCSIGNTTVGRDVNSELCRGDHAVIRLMTQVKLSVKLFPALPRFSWYAYSGYLWRPFHTLHDPAFRVFFAQRRGPRRGSRWSQHPTFPHGEKGFLSTPINNCTAIHVYTWHGALF